MSKKLAAKNPEYEAAKREWRAGHDGRCEMVVADLSGSICAKNSTGVFIGRCPRRADKNPHHMALRGPNLCRIETFMGCCREHHAWIHDHPNEARRLGYLLTK